MSFKSTSHKIAPDGRVTPIQIEYEILPGLPDFKVIGMTAKQHTGIKDRLRFAVKNSGYKYPIHRQVVNISGLDAEDVSLKHLDLSLAIGMLYRSHQIKPKMQKYLLLGELSLDGTLKQSNIDPILNFINQAGQKFDLIIIPSANYKDNAFPNLPLFPAASLNDAITILEKIPIPTVPQAAKPQDSQGNFLYPTFEHIHGLKYLKRAIAITLAGYHKLLIIGFPGLGKTMIARSASNFVAPQQKPYIEFSPTMPLSQILPTKAGLPNLFQKNEHGLVVLNEFNEHSRTSLEAIRHIMDQPNQTAMVATMTPCRCGYKGHPEKPCTCSTRQKSSYADKVPLPLLERFDLIVDVKEEPQLLGEGQVSNTNETQKYFELIKSCQAMQQKNYQEISTDQLLNKCKSDSKVIFRHMYQKYNLSPRRASKLIHVANTISMLEGETQIGEQHLVESLAYQSYTIHALNNQLNATSNR